MANRSKNYVSKKVQREIVKSAKKSPKIALILAIIFIVLAVGGFVLYKKVFAKTTPVVGEFSIHFFPFENLTSGDCTYIKAGDTDILIDAGSTSGSASVIEKYVDNFCTDGVLEYVIVTHGDGDHIAAFTPSGGIFDHYVCNVIIDFTLSNNLDDNTYKAYIQKRQAEIDNGAKHYTALECYNNKNGAQRKYQITESISFEILYNPFYEDTTYKKENNYSVCTLFSHGERKFLFTGDLESDGEQKLLNNNNLPKVDFYKAGHHGSSSSSSNAFLSVIKPDICVANCCAGDKYGFPTQNFISRIAKYTDKVYVPSQKNKSGKFAPLNGNIVISSMPNGLTVKCSNEDKPLKDTTWFKDSGMIFGTVA